jgi:hypothetical protein
MKSLRWLQIASPNVTEQGLAQLAEHLPSLQQAIHTTAKR